MTIGKFIQIHTSDFKTPVFIHVDHIVKVTKLNNGKSSITLDNQEVIITDELYLNIIGAIENITCFYTKEDI